MLRLEKDGWLSDVLGISSWKGLGIAAGTSSAEIRASLLDHAEAGDAFVSVKIPTRDVAAVANATRAGFAVVDVNVTFDWLGGADGASSVSPDRSDMDIGSAGAGDEAAVAEIAGRCFTFSRFHLDPAIGVERANEIKRQWARNASRGRAAAVYVARSKNEVAGFLAVLLSKTRAGTDAVIDLIGIEASHQGGGAGRALSAMFVEQWHGRADRLRVGTQISNIPAMRLYESMGFRVAETSYVLHAHVKNGALAA